MRFHTKRGSAIVAVGVTAALALSACSSGTSTSSPSGSGTGAGSKSVTITFIPKNLGNPYFDTSDAGGKKAVTEMGGKYSEVGPQTGTPDGQVQYINTATQQHIGALVVSANDPKAIGDALNQARAAGTKVVTFDSDTEPQYRDLFINQATSDGIAKVQVDSITKQIGDTGEIAILSASANATNQNAWIALMKKDLAATTRTSSSSTSSTATTTTRRPSTRRPHCCSPTPASRASSRRPPSASPRQHATCRRRTRRARWR